MVLVQLYVYDLSKGLARTMSPALIGRLIEGIWHTGVVIQYGIPLEVFYGGGIQIARPGQTAAGKPDQVLALGNTEIDEQTLRAYLDSVRHEYTNEKYDLIHFNCNNFSDAVSKFLLGKPIPEWITGLPQEFISTPVGQMLLPMLTQFQNQMKRSGGGIPFVPVPNASAQYQDRFVPAVSHAAPAITQPVDVALEDDVPDQNLGLGLVCDIHHPHLKLSLSKISIDAKPLFSKDTKAPQYIEMIKKTNGTLASPKSLSASELELLASFAFLDADSAQKLPKGTVALFNRFFQEWTPAELFPVLSLFRLIVLKPAVAKHFAKDFDSLANLLKQFSSLPVSVQLMLLCTISNMFVANISGSFCASHPLVVETARVALTSKSKVLRIMGANVLFNCSLFLARGCADIFEC